MCYHFLRRSLFFLFFALDPQPGERVLDACAAPGSNTLSDYCQILQFAISLCSAALQGFVARGECLVQVMSAGLVVAAVDTGTA